MLRYVLAAESHPAHAILSAILETLKQRSKMIVPKLDFTLEPFLAFDTKIHFVIAARIGAQA